MTIDQNQDRPVTISQFHSGLEELNSQLQAQFAKFYTSLVTLFEPRFQKIESDLQIFCEQTTKNFDFLFKKFEDLNQEYVVANGQMKRLEKNDESQQADINGLKVKTQNLHEKFESLA